jgi:large exoprotein involved in heme utilization and adhesion
MPAIGLQIRDILSLANNSLISAQAIGSANGGNIDIDTNFVVAFPNQNNDIIASAEQGRGGNINIDARTIFGIEPRNSTPTNTSNDIDASSDFGLAGNISINAPDVNPTRGLEEQPENLVEPEETVAQACSGDGNGTNSFTVTGRGGMPVDPTQPLPGSYVKVSGDRANTQESKNPVEKRHVASLQQKTPISSDNIVPARGMTVNEKGQIILTAYPTDNSTDRPANKIKDCSDRVSTNTKSTGFIFSDNFLVGF